MFEHENTPQELPNGLSVTGGRTGPGHTLLTLPVRGGKGESIIAQHRFRDDRFTDTFELHMGRAQAGNIPSRSLGTWPWQLG